jgi:hypothetical protein
MPGSCRSARRVAAAGAALIAASPSFWPSTAFAQSSEPDPPPIVIDYSTVPMTRCEPKIAFDLWRNPDGTMRVRAEGAATFSGWPTDRLVLTTAVGAKGSGYVPGYPLTSGAYVGIGGGVRF